MNATQEHILLTIKLKGAKSAFELAKISGISKEGMRQQLEKLEKEGYIQSSSEVKGVGRPTTLYHLTDVGDHRFPDAHAGLARQLLKSIQEELGQDALDMVVKSKQKKDMDRYVQFLKNQSTTEEKLESLTNIRTTEGYMAEWVKENDTFYFIENNCPICEAATSCPGFCEAELQNIQNLLGEKLVVERIDHRIAGNRRCTYKIKA